MTYLVSAKAADTLRLGVTDTVESVLQNVAVILATRRGSVPQYRSFGLSMDFLDKPTPAARARMIAEIREAVETWEPRAAVRGVTCSGDPERPDLLAVEVEIADE